MQPALGVRLKQMTFHTARPGHDACHERTPNAEHIQVVETSGPPQDMLEPGRAALSGSSYMCS